MTPDEANATQLNWALNKIFPEPVFPPAVREEMKCEGCFECARLLYPWNRMLICFECREAMRKSRDNDFTK